MKVTPSVHKQMNTFAIAAAAIVAVLALAPPARGQIVYTPVNVTLGLSGTYNLDLNDDGVTDFTIWTTNEGRCAYHSTWVWEFGENPSPGNGAMASRLRKGSEIGPSQVFLSGGPVVLTYLFGEFVVTDGKCGYVYEGPWLERSGYLGLSFQVNGETYYGWAHLKVSGDTATLDGYAYETTPGMAIEAGQK
jgi:hypothetical protein